MPKLVNLGSLCIDLVFSVPNIAQEGETVAGSDVAEYPGGKGLNQSIAASMAGSSVSHYGAVGKDGAILLDALSGAGVNTSHILRLPQNSGRAFVQVDGQGQNAIVIDGGANRQIPITLVEEALSTLDAGDWLLLQNEINDLEQVIERADALGAQIALNLAPIDYRISAYPYSLLDLLIVNKVEGQAVAGSTDEGVDLALNLVEKFPTTSILLTDGRKGSYLLDVESDTLTTTGAFAVDVVDETAAGDAFVGYFMSGLVEQKDKLLGLLDATAAGAIAVSRNGAATSIPSREDVVQLLKRQKINQENQVR